MSLWNTPPSFDFSIQSHFDRQFYYATDRPHRGQILVEKKSHTIFRAVGTEHRIYQRKYRVVSCVPTARKSLFVIFLPIFFT